MTLKQKNVGIIFIGTAKYSNFFKTWHERINKYFLNDCNKYYFILTDQIKDKMFYVPNSKVYYIEHRSWPYVTLNRFTNILKIEKDVKNLDINNLIYIDADLIVNAKIVFDDLFDKNKNYFGVCHPGVVKEKNWHSFVTEGNSTSNIKSLIRNNNINDFIYHQGCFWGGKSDKIIEMCNILSKNIETDLNNKIIADWHDESHMNYYFVKNYHDINTLESSYAFPDERNWYNILSSKGMSPKIVHVNKPMTIFPRFKSGDIKLFN